MAAAEHDGMSDAGAQPAVPADVVDRLHAKVTEMCEAYFTSIGHLQSVALPLSTAASPAEAAAICAEPAGVFAADVVRLHGEFEGLVGELEAEHRSEREQLDALADLQVQLDRADAEIASKVVLARALRLDVRRAVDSRLRDER
mmetsp:Transcript_15349/g.50098  ORF Transcript_15349/g.50098 Transcript_15349/m.50098 type:complete len:144 (+) Transcript_15349:49-480(+)